MTTVQIIALLVFVGVMALIVTERVHRTVAALLGALIIMITGIVPFAGEVVSADGSTKTLLLGGHIDFNTIGVLVGMMLLVAAMRRSGIFEYIAIRSAKLAKGDPWMIMLALVVITASLSALLDNVTTVLLIGPMTLMICKELELNPVPFFITQIIASNIGGTATLIGDPPNIMIGSGAGITFIEFLAVDGPAVVLVLGATLICFRFIYGKKMQVSPENRMSIMEMDERQAITSKSLFVKSIVMIVLVAVAFGLHGVLHLESAIIALSAAAIMMLISRQDIEEIIHGVEWTTIGFFAGLFIVVGGLVETGLVNMFAGFLVDATHGQKIVAILAVLFASAMLSAILDNIPFVAVMIPVLLTMQGSGVDVEPLWWSLSLGACLGGNGTLIGASANVVLSGISNREGYPMTFLAYLKVGMPLMLMSVAISAVYLVLRFGF